MPKKKPPHTEQHFVPQAYLRPWLDTTSTPKGSRNAYGVWVFDRDGTNARQQSPKALFWEDDIYSIPMPDGTRDLRLEHGFGTLEDKYTRIRNRTLMRGLWPSAEETVWLLAFVFAAYFRTPGIHDHYGKQFGELRAMTQRVEQAHTNRPARGWESVVGSPTAPRGWRVVPEEVDFMADYPIQAFMMPALSAALPMLGQMAMAVMQTDDELGFITTDAPCC